MRHAHIINLGQERTYFNLAPSIILCVARLAHIRVTKPVCYCKPPEKEIYFIIRIISPITNALKTLEVICVNGTSGLDLLNYILFTCTRLLNCTVLFTGLPNPKIGHDVKAHRIKHRQSNEPAIKPSLFGSTLDCFPCRDRIYLTLPPKHKLSCVLSLRG